MGRWVSAAFALATLVGAPSAILQVVVGQTVFRAVGVPAGSKKALSVSCPPGYFALSAGVAKAGAGMTTLAARPLGLRTFGFRLANAAGSDQRVTVAAACRRIRATRSTSPYLKLAPLRRLKVRVGSSSLRQAHLTCPSGTVPAGGGFDIGRSGALSVLERTQTLRTFSFSVLNRGEIARAASFYGSCLTVVRPVGAGAAQLQLRLETDTVPVPTGSTVSTRTCPRGWLSLATGYSLPAGLELDGAAAVGRTGRWSLTNVFQKPVLVKLQLVCVRLG